MNARNFHLHRRPQSLCLIYAEDLGVPRRTLGGQYGAKTHLHEESTGEISIRTATVSILLVLIA